MSDIPREDDPPDPPVRAPERAAFPRSASSSVGRSTQPGQHGALLPGEGAVLPGDVAAIAEQLGREPRGLRAVAHRCPCGLPDVVETAPRLPDGTPFPTLYYLTCPRAAAAIGSLEASGLMRQMTERLAGGEADRAAYERAHQDYLARRDAAADEAGVPRLPAGTQSAGGMPERVKCLHALVAHELAVPGSNPFGREAIDAVGAWWSKGPCVHPEETQ